MAELDDVPQDVDAVTFEVIRYHLLSINEATAFASEHSSHEGCATAQQRPLSIFHLLPWKT